MNRRNGIIAGVVAVAVLILLMGSLSTVHQTRQALILQLGNPVRVIDTPGLHAKIPFIQAVEFYEKRVLDFDAPSVELTPCTSPPVEPILTIAAVVSKSWRYMP